MSRFYTMLMDHRVQPIGNKPDPNGFEEFTGHHGEVPFVEVGGAAETVTDIPVVDTPVIDEPNPSSGLFSVTFRAFGNRPRADFCSSLSQDLIVAHDPTHAISQEYRTLAGEIVEQLCPDGPSVVALCGAGARSGTTTVLLNLALTLAADPDARIAVIEANPTRPAFAARLAIDAEPGVGDVLSGDESFSGAVKRVPDTSLLALPLGRPIHGLVGLGDFLTTLRHRFDWVLVDVSTELMLEVDVGLSHAADACYLVVRDSIAEDQRLEEVKSRLSRAGVSMRGMVTTHGAQR